MFGSYLANQNDAKILKNIIQNLNGLCKLLIEGFLFDRGLDITDDLEKKNLQFYCQH